MMPTRRIKLSLETCMLRYLTIPKFAELSGYTADAIRSKIRDGIWREGHEGKRAPDGRNLIGVDG